jgi:cbb3-type cytochrome oxidase maturation protein
MDVLFLLIPLSSLLMLAIVGVFAWALSGGQFEDIEREGERILDEAQGAAAGNPQHRLREGETP